MTVDTKLFITLTPGNSFLDRLTGKTKVRLFFLVIFILTATWDLRILTPALVISLICLCKFSQSTTSIPLQADFAFSKYLKSMKNTALFFVIRTAPSLEENPVR